MGIEPKNYILSLADSTPLAAVTAQIQGINTRFWTTVGLRIYPSAHSDICAQKSVPRIGAVPAIAPAQNLLENVTG